MRLFLPFSSRFFFYRVNLQPLGRIGFYQGGNCNSANRSSSRDHLHLSSFEHFAYAVFYTRQIAISDIGGLQPIRSTINFIYTSFPFFSSSFFFQSTGRSFAQFPIPDDTSFLDLAHSAKSASGGNYQVIKFTRFPR